MRCQIFAVVALAALAAALGGCSGTGQPASGPGVPSVQAAPLQPVTVSPLALPPRPRVDLAERDCLAEAVYFEGRGESREGQVAVAHVVLNRAASRGQPRRACVVIREGEERGKGRCQFHWRCDGRPDAPTDLVAWREAQDVADQVLAGGATDPTRGALYFHAAHVAPGWTTRLRRTAQIGAHVYYAQ